MKLKFIDPDQIMGAVLALVVLAVGVFAVFIVLANVPIVAPVAQNTNLISNSTLANGGVHLEFNGTVRWIPATGYLNNTALCVLQGLTAGATPHWMLLQAAGACNGTFVTNATGVESYRLAQPGYHLSNSSVMFSFAVRGQSTTSIQNATFTAVINVSGTANQVFNIIGVVLIIAAIMAIVGLVYSYIKPRM